MRNDTREHFNAYLSQLARLNGVSSTTATFSVDPTVQQTLETRMQESSEFLGKIGIIGVDELQGEKVGLGVSSTIAGRTDTTGNGVRQPRDVSSLDKKGYEAKKTDFDTAIRYAQLDAWAKFPDFQARLRDAILKRQALDRIMIGFNGVSAAATTDRQVNALLQDVNIGWLEQYRLNAPARVLKEGKLPARSSSVAVPPPTTTTLMHWCSTRSPTSSTHGTARIRASSSSWAAIWCTTNISH